MNVTVRVTVRVTTTPPSPQAISYKYNNVNVIALAASPEVQADASGQASPKSCMRVDGHGLVAIVSDRKYQNNKGHTPAWM